MWPRRPLFLDSGSTLRTSGGLAATIVVTLGLIGTLILFRQKMQPARRQETIRPG
jgi:hypothetical protein